MILTVAVSLHPLELPVPLLPGMRNERNRRRWDASWLSTLAASTFIRPQSNSLNTGSKPLLLDSMAGWLTQDPRAHGKKIDCEVGLTEAEANGVMCAGASW